jgi:glycine/D-amino acid oxidase-like deaminating enzyme
MNVHNGHLFWPETIKNDIRYPVLEAKINCDVLIVGGGISGALCAFILAKEIDLNIVLIDKAQPGSGSSSAHSGILQSASDRMLHELIEQKGEQDAVFFYQLCQQSLERLSVISQNLSQDTDWTPKKSLFIAGSDEDSQKLRMEYDALKKFGFMAEYMSPIEIASKFPFSKPAALATGGTADVNPYKLTHLLLKEAEESGVRIFGETPLMHKEKTVHGFTNETEKGTIQSRYIIFATGFENEFLVRQLGARLSRSYTVVTEAVPSLGEWHYGWIIRETHCPFYFMRTTEEGKILAGGLEEENSDAPFNKEMITRHSKRLVQRINETSPGLSPRITHSWCTAVGESPDGLPYIGEHPNRIGEYYCLGFGTNKIVYSMMGAEIIKDLITKGFHPASRLFTIARSASL